MQPLNLTLTRQGWGHLYEFEASLVYIVPGKLWKREEGKRLTQLGVVQGFILSIGF